MTDAKARRLKQIFDIDGALMYEGSHKSVRELVEKLVGDKRPLDRADLADYDLSHLDLSKGRFEGARLDGAKLRGANLTDAVFNGASMKGVSAAGVDAASAQFMDCDFSPLVETVPNRQGRLDSKGQLVKVEERTTSDFFGAVLSYARFDGATETEVDFTSADMSSSVHSGAEVRRSKFDKTRLHNVEWTEATVIGNSFVEADMTPRMNIAAAHLPDRTNSAIIVGNEYEKTVFGSGNRGFILDSMVVGKIKLTAWGLVTSGLFAAGAMIPINLEETIRETVGTGAAFILAASALTLVRTPIEDLLRERGTEMLAGTTVRVRSAISELWKRGKSIGSLAVALLSRGYADHVEKCLKSRHDGIYRRVKAAAMGDYDVIVCDRKHLAEALVRVNEVMNNRLNTDHSVILVRMGRDERFAEAPRAVVFNPDNGIEALWDPDVAGNIVHRKWDETRHQVGTAPDMEMDVPVESHLRDFQPFCEAFCEAMLAEHGLDDLKVSHETHMIRKGRDNSIVVVKADNGRVDNYGGPAVVTPDNERLYFRNSMPYDAKGYRIRPGSVENEAPLPARGYGR